MAARDDRQEIRSLSDDDLIEHVADAKDELFKLRFKRVTGGLDSHSQLPKARRQIARLLTEIRSREIAAAEGLGGK